MFYVYFKYQTNIVTIIQYFGISIYQGNPYVIINDNNLSFDEDNYTTAALMPSGERESISSVKPTGWINNDYPGLVDGDYLF